MSSMRRDNLGLIEVKPTELGRTVRSLVIPNDVLATEGPVNPLGVKFWELVGLLVGSGFYEWNSRLNNYYVMLFVDSDYEEIEEGILRPLKDADVIKDYYSKDKGNIAILSKPLAYFMRNFKDNTGKSVIPELMYGLPRESQEAFLRGLFTAKGLMVMSEKGLIIKLSVTNDEMVEAVRTMLYLVGVANAVYVEKNFDKLSGENLGKCIRNIIVKDIERFQSNIGFIVARKQQMLKRCEISFTRNVLRGFDTQKVMKVEEIEYGDYVYDIEVDGTHRFFANWVLVHNTDSIFVILKSKNIFDQISEIHELAEKINEMYDYFAMSYGAKIHYHEIEAKKIYKRFLIVTKKRYAGYKVWPEKGIEAKGIEIVRSDQAEITKKIYKRILEMILKEGKSPMDALKHIEYIKKLFTLVMFQ